MINIDFYVLEANCFCRDNDHVFMSRLKIISFHLTVYARETYLLNNLTFYKNSTNAFLYCINKQYFSLVGNGIYKEGAEY